MADLFNDVKPFDVVFLEKFERVQVLRRFQGSSSWKTLRDESGKWTLLIQYLCANQLFQHHDRGSSSHDPPYREMNLFIRESTAYRRLKAKGLCNRGDIPDFYGTITKIKATDWPDLHMFHEDKLPPNAILIEYIPNMQQMDLSNFLESYPHRFRDILCEIHKARGALASRQKIWVDKEMKLVDYFVKNLPEDYKDGKLKRVWDYYYEYI
ncbi:hypothetical protein AJ79_08829 [Helicocarpus griseus UAMH5409]|uniref:Aminoglycoside phosphotransferase domain-containing protein n=1 Tax=Helicocarpus griseus UAMH5409 TaxID=1447875 RepID=A0A2B7WPQ8_9EURO|nr:hypothetical protein AJ79_08829 [Helicocarpus griseus UAMH5409]